jgi:hypothetical protein
VCVQAVATHALRVKEEEEEDARRASAAAATVLGVLLCGVIGHCCV